ncbi:MAG: hypothetical protein FWH32_03370 [Clostridiales bacterium]|nr:hypothetical protein [Clostridiales bacterium]
MEFNGVGNATEGRVSGVGNIDGGVHDKLHVDGVCTVSGDFEAESFKVSGVCTCTGDAAAKEFNCSGVLTVERNLRAGNAKVDGIVTVNGGKFEADRIDCKGVLTAKGEVSADIIKADGRICAKEIVGDKITIRSYWQRLFFGLFVPKSKISEIDMIEGTTVELHGVHAKSVSGHDVHIGKKCNIDRVDASGELTIHPSARVGEVTGRE